MSKPDYDYRFCPVRREEPADAYLDHYPYSRLVVASEEEWEELYLKTSVLPPLKILIEAEVLFSEHGIKFFEDTGFCSDEIQSRLFKTLKGTQADVWWRLGMSVRNFMKSVPKHWKEYQITL